VRSETTLVVDDEEIVVAAGSLMQPLESERLLDLVDRVIQAV
jgi:hypothetical protein